MTVKEFPITNKQDWLENRLLDVTSTEGSCMFNKNPIICPKCEFEFDPDLLLKSRKGRSIATKTEVNEVSSDVKKEEKIEEGLIDNGNKQRNSRKIELY